MNLRRWTLIVVLGFGSPLYWFQWQMTGIASSCYPTWCYNFYWATIHSFAVINLLILAGLIVVWRTKS